MAFSKMRLYPLRWFLWHYYNNLYTELRVTEAMIWINGRRRRVNLKIFNKFLFTWNISFFWGEVNEEKGIINKMMKNLIEKRFMKNWVKKTFKKRLTKYFFKCYKFLINSKSKLPKALKKSSIHTIFIMPSLQKQPHPNTINNVIFSTTLEWIELITENDNEKTFNRAESDLMHSSVCAKQQEGLWTEKKRRQKTICDISQRLRRVCMCAKWSKKSESWSLNDNQTIEL